MAMKFKIWDHANKSFVFDRKTGTIENGFRDMKALEFGNNEEAERWKEADLASGNYYNRPHTVYEIIPEELDSHQGLAVEFIN